MKLTKTEIIQKLYDIAKTQNLNLDKEVQETIRNEIIPMNVIKIINRYDKNFLQIYNTYNVIFKSRFKNPLYRNLKNSDCLSVEELAVALSSLVTKILISCTKIENEKERMLYAKAMNIERINNAITNYSLYNDSEELINYGQEVKELLKLLYTND